MVEIKIRDNPATGYLEFYFIKGEDGKRFLAKPIELDYTPIKPGQMYPAPTLELPEFMAQEFLKELSNSLEKIGIQPEGVEKTKGILEATKYHLEDMRTLIFKNRGDLNGSCKQS